MGNEYLEDAQNLMNIVSLQSNTCTLYWCYLNLIWKITLFHHALGNRERSIQAFCFWLSLSRFWIPIIGHLHFHRSIVIGSELSTWVRRLSQLHDWVLYMQVPSFGIMKRYSCIKSRKQCKTLKILLLIERLRYKSHEPWKVLLPRQRERHFHKWWAQINAPEMDSIQLWNLLSYSHCTGRHMWIRSEFGGNASPHSAVPSPDSHIEAQTCLVSMAYSVHWKKEFVYFKIK